MNERQREIRRRKIRDKLNQSEKGDDVFSRKGVRVHGDNFRHFMVKSAVYKVLQEAGHDNVYTEVTFPNGCIADILDTHMARVYEVETNYTQTGKEAKWKDFDYPWIEDVIVLDPVEIDEQVHKKKLFMSETKDLVKPELVLDD